MSSAPLQMYDNVTGLPNRSALYAWLGRALDDWPRQAKTISVVILDLDDFRSLNETFGRQIGDAVLKTVGERLSRATRTIDMVSRLGNDEFGCVIIGLPIEDPLCTPVSALLAAIAGPMNIGAMEITMRASIGIAIRTPDGSDANGLMERASRAMYRAKLDKSGYTLFKCAPSQSARQR